ncbi:MAG: fumarylacetoacetate hydrolase family protein [Candidatus Marinimicrobia bacterium]|jgi:acylpyruvate hydrolase|nr:fumarylacetoacetate hydrolase family protein [Candidatus Neomarinimicrobiota bacterium]MBT3947087.1 fumarylacetoacetate hydrolase family protein [Candidatus Neomarinimicrobiota bacterium]MBT4307275.1 fumarylacetoacetate hydrolase family protein [Candidatus Neomarinimicrobiota bacterium]MBT4736218.1 fumarylacetoacetate hydrolase family protein [Candidatus Neomarinimicrobiota bacterium]MBT5385333.1 fumarylacetoacetate hydrolase family protein [Candidatus Neomarinimicrobiota bacterium]
MNYDVKSDGESVLVRNIYCVGRNYKAHAAELNNDIPKSPIVFQKSIPALNTSEEVVLPKDREIQHELEIVVLIGKDGENISIDDAKTFIHGYGLGLDLTDRKYQMELKANKLPWLLAKSFKGSAVVSSFKPNEIMEDFWLKVNGNIRQKGSRNDMVFSISAQIAYLSEMIPLIRGDLIFTGTPSGVGPLSQGDQLELGIGDHSIHSISVS